MNAVTTPSLAPITSIHGAYRHIEPTPGARLRCGRVHEIMGAGADMFAVASSAQSEADVVWIALGRDLQTLCPAGLEPHLPPDRILLVEAVSRGEILWAMDQALRANGGFTVIADMPNAPSLKESRHLQLAAEQGGGLGLILLRGHAGTSAAQTRWNCEPLADDAYTWQWICQKGKNGEAGAWRVHSQGAQNAENTLHMAATASA